MSSDSEPNADVSLGDSQSSGLVNEASSEYRANSRAIDTDTRLASAGETEAMWPGRPARRSLIQSLERSASESQSGHEPAAYRGDSSTSHTRRDMLTGDWTIFAPKRDERPNEYETQSKTAADTTEKSPQANDEATVPGVDSSCPFCAGAEAQTPEAVWSAKLGELDRSPADNDTSRFARPVVKIAPCDQPGWDVRIVPNKFPAVSAFDSAKDGHIDRHSLFPITNVVGGHEVIIESQNHAESVRQFDPSHVYLTLLAFRERIQFWRGVPGINYISVFKNCGPEAGASLRHSHSQLIATSLMPHRVRTSLVRAEHHRARTGCSLGCDLLRAELDEKRRIIDQTDSFVAFCPFASRFAGLIRITSNSHQPHFETLGDASIDQLASFLWRVLSWVDQAYPGKAFNYLLHTCPPGSKQPQAFQWSLDVFPRLNKTAGFEWSSDCMINSLLPEAAAARYREIARQNDPRNILAVR